MFLCASSFVSVRVPTPLRLAVVVALASACAPPGDSGSCSEDTECGGRGQVCDVANAVCIDDPTFDDSATRSPTPASFTNELVPFFRGEVCTVSEAKSGSTIPVLMRPCLHPCMDVNRFQTKHFYSCSSGQCEGQLVVWMSVSSKPEGCPEDAFGRFDASECVYELPGSQSFPPELEISTTTATGLINANMALEVPFLTNADAAAIDMNDSTDYIRSIVEGYPRQSSRLIPPIQVFSTSAEPPSTCADNPDCECTPIGM